VVRSLKVIGNVNNRYSAYDFLFVFRRNYISVYIGWEWRNFFISYLCQLFFRHFVRQARRNVCYSDITFIDTIIRIIRTFS